jgi:hypothetical protein
MNKVLLVISLPWTSKLAWNLMMESKTAGLEHGTQTSTLSELIKSGQNQDFNSHSSAEILILIVHHF